MKKHLAIILCLLMLFLVCSITAFAENSIVTSGKCGETEKDNVNWTLYDSGELVFSGCGAISAFDFESCKTTPWAKYLGDIWCVIVEEGVTSIGNYAFSGSDNSGVTTYCIPKSVVSIGIHSLKAFGETGRNKTSVIYAGRQEDWDKVSGRKLGNEFIVTFDNKELTPFIKFTKNEISVSRGVDKTIYYDSYLGKYNKRNPVFETSGGVEVLSSSISHVIAVKTNLQDGTLTAKIIDSDGKTVSSDSVIFKTNFGAIFTYPLEVISGLPYYGLYFFIIGRI